MDEPDAMFCLVLSLCMKCLCQPVWQHGNFRTVFFDSIAVEKTFSAMSLTFCPGLYEVATALAPPLYAWFLTLPDVRDKALRVWAIYVLCLWKASCFPRIYVGSATAAKRGLRTRMGNYDNGRSIPEYVQRALDNGYIIKHAGVLCSAPIPPAGSVPLFRLAFILLECMFIFLFWAMIPTADDAMSECCPWDINDLNYFGLCSHSSLCEGINGDLNLTPKQLSDVDNERKARKIATDKVYNAAYYQKMISTEAGRQHYRAIQRKAGEKYRRNPHGKALAKKRRHEARARAEKRHVCPDCGLCAASPSKITSHRRHCDGVNRQRGPNKNPYGQGRRR